MLGWCFQLPGEPKSTHNPTCMARSRFTSLARMLQCLQCRICTALFWCWSKAWKSGSCAALNQGFALHESWDWIFLRHLCQCHRFPCHCQPQFKRSSSNAITKDLVSVCQTLRYEMRRWDWLHWWGSPQPLFHESRWLCPHCTCFLRAQELGFFPSKSSEWASQNSSVQRHKNGKKQEVAETDANRWCITTAVHAMRVD